MRRFLFAVAVLLAVTASPALAGYVILRVLLEGGGAPPSTTPGAGQVGTPPAIGAGGPGGRPGGGGSALGPPPLGGSAGPNPFNGGSGMPGAPAGPAGEIDHTRSVV